MSALRKQDYVVDYGSTELPTDDACRDDRHSWHDDVTEAGVDQLRASASSFFAGKKWKVIDGYVGSKTAECVD